MRCAKKKKKYCENLKKKLSKNARYMSKIKVRQVFYSFNLCGSPVYYHRNQIQRKQVRLFFISTLMFPAEKMCIFFSHSIQDWEEIALLKNEKSPGIMFSYFRTNPVVTVLATVKHLIFTQQNLAILTLYSIIVPFDAFEISCI